MRHYTKLFTPNRVAHQFAIDADSFRCSESLRSELLLLTTLQRLSITCWSPTLKANAAEIERRKQKLAAELELRRLKTARSGTVH